MRVIVTLIAGVAGLAMAGLVGLAAAAPPSSLATANNAKLGETIVVDSRGLTVYELRPETAQRLLCTKANGCFQIWRPLTVGSAKTKLTAAHGITGKLGILHRSGIFQVTLGGHPLYHFTGDASMKGSANGQGLHSFQGTWHVIAAASSNGTTPTNTTPTTTTTTPTTPYNPTPTTPTTTTTTSPYCPPLCY
jgi:predicted lipoprotein with Yx(FWY)xxD motif